MTIDEPNDAESGKPDSAAENRSRSSLAWLGILTGGALAVGVVLFLTVILHPGLPILTRADWNQALAKWREKEKTFANYNLEIHVVGAQDSRYHIEVRDHKVTTAIRNDDPLRDQRTWETWSVPGMFGTMESDLETIDADNAAKKVNLVVRARFDPDTGVPLEYQRNQFEPPFDAHWLVTLFEPLP